MNKLTRYPAEVRERAVRMVLEQQGQYRDALTVNRMNLCRCQQSQVSQLN